MVPFKIKYLLIIVYLIQFTPYSQAQETSDYYSADKVRLSIDCIHQMTFRLYKSQHNGTPNFDLPEIRLAHEVDLVDFQNLVEPQWNFRPSAVTNVFLPTENLIFLSSSRELYEKNGRSIFDSLAHELVHFYQVNYSNYTQEDLSNRGDILEYEAVSVQSEFRQLYGSYVSNSDFHCPLML